MLCPICGNDRILVIGRVERFESYDLRRVVCQACARMMTTRTIIESVSIVDPDRLQTEEVVPAQITDALRAHLLGRAPHPNWRERLDG